MLFGKLMNKRKLILSAGLGFLICFGAGTLEARPRGYRKTGTATTSSSTVTVPFNPTSICIRNTGATNDLYFDYTDGVAATTDDSTNHIVAPGNAFCFSWQDPNPFNTFTLGVITSSSTTTYNVDATRSNASNSFAEYLGTGSGSGGGSGGTQFAEDIAHTTGDVGTELLAVRRDANTSLVDATGDYAPLQVDATGNLKVNIIAGAGSGGTAAADESAFTLGTTNVTALGCIEATDNMPANALGAVRCGVNRVLDVDVISLPAIPAGTNNIGDVDVLTVNGVAPAFGTGARGATVQRVTIATDDLVPVNGTVAVSSITTAVVPGTAATNLGKAEDAAHADGDVGVELLAVRRDANTSLSGATGDYSPLQVDATGNLKVAIISGAGSGGTSLADNAAFTPATTSFTPVGGEVDDTATTAATENSAGAVRMTVQRALHVNLRDSTGAELGVGGYAEDTATTAADILNMAGVVRSDVPATLVGTDQDRTQMIVGATGKLWVDASDIAHDAVDSGNPVKTGAKAISYGSAPTAVAAADRVNDIADRQGVRFSLPYHPNQTVTEYLWTTAQTDDAVISVSSGTRIGIMSYQVLLDEATTVGVAIRCGFGTSTLTTAPTDGNAAANTFLNHRGAVPGGGLNNPPGFFVMGANDEDVRCTTEATTSGTGTLIITYFTTAN